MPEIVSAPEPPIAFSMIALKAIPRLSIKDQLTSRIKSFQVSEGENSGYFEDLGLLKKADKFNFRKFKFEKDFNARRAESCKK